MEPWRRGRNEHHQQEKKGEVSLTFSLKGKQLKEES